MLLSEDKLERMIPFSSDRLRLKFLTPLNEAMEEFNINTPLRIAAFIAQITHESGSLHYVKELASGKAYNNRADLGNRRVIALEIAKEKGLPVGVLYKGRGLIQITGFYNYSKCGEALNLDLIHNPELLEQPVNACRSAAWFWEDHECNSYADIGAFYKICQIINGKHPNHLQERFDNYELCKKVLNIPVTT